jgi:proteasome lid subunit RPN8/RPN11
MQTPRIFISYSSLDIEFVEREIIPLLKRHGLDVWYSKESIESTAEWEKRIKQGLHICDWFLVVLSPQSVTSDWVQAEVDWALEKRKGKVIPVLYQDCDPTELHLKLRRIQYIDFGRNQESARGKLLAVWGLNSVIDTDEIFGRAVTAIARGEWDVATTHLNSVLGQKPDNTQARNLLILARQQLELTTAAVKAVGEPLIEEPFPTNQVILWKRPAQQGEPYENVDSPPPVAIVITQEVLFKVNQHVAQSLDSELGGFLLGNHLHCPMTGREFIVIDQYAPSKFVEATEVSLSFTAEAWMRLLEELNGKFRGKSCVGWYHSHPRMDVFLSRYDMQIMDERFPEAWMTALVLEPEKHRGGFFSRRGERLDPNTPVEFYELLERESRESVMAWGGYLGVDMLTLEKPILKKLNTLSASVREDSEVQQKPSNDGASFPKRGSRKLLIWLIAVSTILSLALILGLSKLLGTN